MPNPLESQERFSVLIQEFAGQTGVTTPLDAGGRGFGSSALKINGSIFAMLTRDHLVVKLPRDRVTALIEDGTGAAFDANKGRPMKEWVTVLTDEEVTWHELAQEALAFVSGRSQ